MKANELFSQQEISRFKAEGYTDDDINNAIEEAKKSELQQSYQQTQTQRVNDPRRSASNSFISSPHNDNLIQWQLELDSILERIEHMLRGDKPTWENGSVIWKSPQETFLLKDYDVINEDDLTENEKEILDCLDTKIGKTSSSLSEITNIDEKELKKILIKLSKKKLVYIDDGTILNDFGISEIMRILSNYINRNTILSNYSEDVINTKLYDLGNDLTDLIYLKYEMMGLKTLEKRKLYAIIIREMIDIVHSSYLRALNGGERESLREARQVSQTDNVVPNGVNVYNGQPLKERGLLNPLRWTSGKYK